MRALCIPRGLLVCFSHHWPDLAGFHASPHQVTWEHEDGSKDTTVAQPLTRYLGLVFGV